MLKNIKGYLENKIVFINVVTFFLCYPFLSVWENIKN